MELNYQAPELFGPNHVWELGCCPWNVPSAASHLGEHSSECRPQILLGEQISDHCALC
jgi:hypothetical protein